MEKNKLHDNLLKKINIILFVVFGICYFGVNFSRPTKNDFPKREAMLYERLPEICIYDTNKNLKNELKVYTSFSTPVAEGKFVKGVSEKDIVSYYENELRKLGWEKFNMREYKSDITKKKCRTYSSMNYERKVETYIHFDDAKNNNANMFYEISFDGRF